MYFRSCDFIFNFFAFFTKNSISTLSVILFFMKFCVAQTFWVERYLDDVLEVLQVVGSTKKNTKLVDIYHRKGTLKNYDDCIINEKDI